MNGLTVTELHTQDGYDWPSGCTDERWPVEAEPKTMAEWEEELVSPFIQVLEKVVADFDRKGAMPPPLAAPGVIPKPRRLVFAEGELSRYHP